MLESRRHFATWRLDIYGTRFERTREKAPSMVLRCLRPCSVMLEWLNVLSESLLVYLELTSCKCSKSYFHDPKTLLYNNICVDRSSRKSMVFTVRSFLLNSRPWKGNLELGEGFGLLIMSLCSSPVEFKGEDQCFCNSLWFLSCTNRRLMEKIPV